MMTLKMNIWIWIKVMAEQVTYQILRFLDPNLVKELVRVRRSLQKSRRASTRVQKRGRNAIVKRKIFQIWKKVVTDLEPPAAKKRVRRGEDQTFTIKKKALTRYWTI